MKEILGRARAKKGMFEGDVHEGELEIGQVSATINEVLPASSIIQNMMTEFECCRKKMFELNFCKVLIFEQNCYALSKVLFQFIVAN
jgi:enoyl-[acyl-carrier protein] reductase II